MQTEGNTMTTTKTVAGVTIPHLNDDGTITREWMVGSPDPEAVHTVTLTRVRLYPVVAHPGPAWRWLYKYTPDNGLRREYGTGLQDARAYVRRVFPHATIVEAW